MSLEDAVQRLIAAKGRPVTIRRIVTSTPLDGAAPWEGNTSQTQDVATHGAFIAVGSKESRNNDEVTRQSEFDVYVPAVGLSWKPTEQDLLIDMRTVLDTATTVAASGTFFQTVSVEPLSPGLIDYCFVMRVKR